MKNRLFLVLIFFASFSLASGQNIAINLPLNPSPNTADWGTGRSVFTVTVTGTAALAESRVLMFIRSSSGQVVCGSNQVAMAQPANIKPGAPKVWAGQTALSLLGGSCQLPVGSYELCVQIFSIKSREAVRPDVEKCAPFEIKSRDCSPPNNINPATDRILNAIDILKPLTFNWTPFVMPGVNLVNYRLYVWEVEDGQTVYEALYNNFPLISADVRGRTNHIVTPGVIEKRNADYVWRVEANDDEGKLLCRTAQSEPTPFSVKIAEANPVQEKQDSAVASKDSCCVLKIVDNGKSIAIAPANIAAIDQKFNITPLNVKYLSAEIVAVKETTTGANCSQCGENENWTYQFISPNTASWNGGTAWIGSPVNATNYFPAKRVEWHCLQQGDLQLKFAIALPEKQNGCARQVSVCIRYRFTDENCVTCEKLICYDITN